MKTKDKALVTVLALSIVSAALLSEEVGKVFVFFGGIGFPYGLRIFLAYVAQRKKWRFFWQWPQ